MNTENTIRKFYDSTSTGGNTQTQQQEEVVRKQLLIAIQGLVEIEYTGNSIAASALMAINAEDKTPIPTSAGSEGEQSREEVETLAAQAYPIEKNCANGHLKKQAYGKRTAFIRGFKAASSLPVSPVDNWREDLIKHFEGRNIEFDVLINWIDNHVAPIVNSTPVEVKEDAKVKWDKLNKGIKEWENEQSEVKEDEGELSNYKKVIANTPPSTKLAVKNWMDALDELEKEKVWSAKLSEALEDLGDNINPT